MSRAYSILKHRFPDSRKAVRMIVRVFTDYRIHEGEQLTFINSKYCSWALIDDIKGAFSQDLPDHAEIKVLEAIRKSGVKIPNEKPEKELGWFMTILAAVAGPAGAAFSSAMRQWREITQDEKD